MADDNFRSSRPRNPQTRETGNANSREFAGDPLAELARLIGQGDPYAEGGQQAYRANRSDADTAGSGLDWAADESYAEQHDRSEARYVRPPPPPPAAYPPQDRGYENPSPPGSRFFSGPATKFNGFRDEAEADYSMEPHPDSPGPQLPSFMSQDSAGAAAPAEHHEAHGADEPPLDGDEDYAGDDHYDRPSPRQRPGLVVVMAVLGLAVIGTAGAFGYRYMFGGSVLPTLPPIIKASNAPNKIVPGYGEAKPNTSSQSNVASAGSTEKLVSREEQPVNMEPAPTGPRVVSTIPITSGQGAVPAGQATGATSGGSGPGSPWPTAPAPYNALQAAPSSGGASPTPTVAAPAAQTPASSEPKKIHTVTIRADQSGGADAMPVPQPAPAAAARNAARPAPTKPSNGARPAANAPLSIIPGAEGEPAAPAASHSRMTAAPIALASAEPVAGVAASSSSGGGYAVQITSQRTAAEAQASFKALQAKFPNQIGAREPIIRRADLGAKGTYYRALVGPFASMEEAAGLCSGLKAAGGNCIVQRN